MSFLVCSIREIRLLGLEKKAFLPPPKEASLWRLEKEGDVPLPLDDEEVVLAPFYQCGFGLPLHPFIRGLLFEREMASTFPIIDFGV